MNNERLTDEILSENLRKHILDAIDQVGIGFKRVMMMYTIAFYCGIFLIFLSLILTLVFGENIFILFFGGAGLLDIFSFFAFKPAEKLQISRGNLSQLIAAISTWLNDMHNWGLVIKLELTDGNYDEDVIGKISKTMIAHTLTIMWAIDVFVEEKVSEDIKKHMQDVIKMLEMETQTP